MRILITGASGLLGGKFTTLALAKKHQVFAAYKDHKPLTGEPVHFDQTVESEVNRVFHEFRPQIVVNTAAMTDVDFCETQPEQALLVNGTSVSYLANMARELNAFLVQVSTDYVFSGDKGEYSENDTPDPVNHYGLSKLKGELAAKNAGEDQYSVARASVVYGWGRTYRLNAATYVYDKLSKSEKISMVNDQYCSATLNTSLAQMILEIGEKKISGIIHTSGATRINRYEFAVNVGHKFNLDTSLIGSVSAKQLNWKAKRPRDSSLSTVKASRLLENKPLSINRALSIFAEEHAELATVGVKR